jgi:competence protein ComEC
MLAGLIAGVFVYGARKPAADAVHVRVLSVGAGAATVIHLPNGHAFLYDVGHSPPYELGGAVIAPTLNTTGIRRLDGIMISHPNLDHYSGVLDVIDRIPTRRVWVSSPFLDARRDSRLVGYVLDSLTKRGVPVTAIHAGDCLTGTGDVAIDVLWPSHDESVDALEANDTSIVLRLRYGHSSMLLCGDIERAAQAWLLDHADLHADVLVLPHHGSYKPWTPAFLQAVAPTYLVRSSNQRDEQSAPGLMKLAEDYRYYNTAESGAIDIMLTRDSIRLEAFHGQQEGRPVLTPAGP